MAKRLRKEVFTELGTQQLTDQEALSLLGRQLRGTEAQLMVAAMDWGRFAASLPREAASGSSPAPSFPSNLQRRTGLPPAPPISRAERLRTLDAIVRRCVASVLGISDAAAVGAVSASVSWAWTR